MSGRKAGNICCLPHCSRSRRLFPDLKLFRFPNFDSPLYKEWVTKCNIDEQLMERPNLFLCDRHFTLDCIGTRYLKRGAVPSLNLSDSNESTSKETRENNPNDEISINNNFEEDNNPDSLDYVKPNATCGKYMNECRCCKNSSGNLIQLDSVIKISGEMEKSYKNLLYEILELNISTYQDNKMPQQICQKCSILLKNSYKFIQQATKVSQQYLKIADQQNTQDEDIQNNELLQESLIKVKELPSSVQEQIKENPLNIESEVEKKIKQEESETELCMTSTEDNEEFIDERDFFQNSNIDEQSSKGDEDSDEVEEEILPCPLSSYKASRVSALEHGQDKVLDSSKKYPYNLCQYSDERIDSLRKHIKRKHLSKQETINKEKIPKLKEKECFLCTFCGQSYSSKCFLESHVRVHTGERPFSLKLLNDL